MSKGNLRFVLLASSCALLILGVGFAPTQQNRVSSGADIQNGANTVEAGFATLNPASDEGTDDGGSDIPCPNDKDIKKKCGTGGGSCNDECVVCIRLCREGYDACAGLCGGGLGGYACKKACKVARNECKGECEEL